MSLAFWKTALMLVLCTLLLLFVTGKAMDAIAESRWFAGSVCSAGSLFLLGAMVMAALKR